MTDRTTFVERYGGVYEHSPWVAEAVARHAAELTTAGEIADAMAEVVDDAPRERKLVLIRAHPDLAGRAQIAGELTADSSAEQSSAGLDRCTPDEYARFRELNDRYREKFGFPFVMAVRDSSRQDILAAFERRLKNDPPTEFETAVAEIHQIARLRIEALEGGP